MRKFVGKIKRKLCFLKRSWNEEKENVKKADDSRKSHEVKNNRASKCIVYIGYKLLNKEC